MYSTRGALALIWRGGIGDHSGVQLWSPDEMTCASALRDARMGSIEVRFVPRDGKMVEANFWVQSEEGNSLWQQLLRIVEVAVHGDES